MLGTSGDFCYQEPIQSMYMSTIPNKVSKRPSTAVRNILNVQDIEGCRSRFIEKPRMIRQTYINKNDDIDRSHSKVLIPKQVNRPEFSMRVDDISGTRTKVNKFTSTRRTDPLNPVYEVPHVEYYPVEEPKFIRDNMITYDIEGTSTKESYAMKLAKHNKFQNVKQEVLSSIDLKRKNRLRQTENKGLLDVKDINLKKEKIFRETNPLDPQYLVPNGKEQQKGSHSYGAIKGSKPTAAKPKFNHPDFSLHTDDIPGAKTKVNNFVSQPKQAIREAMASSFKRGMSSNRKTNPLNPNYNYPGCSEVKRPSSSVRPKTAHQRFDDFIK